MKALLPLIAALLISNPVLSHSGRTDSEGCHAGSVPHHCHTQKEASEPDPGTPFWIFLLPVALLVPLVMLLIVKPELRKKIGISKRKG